MSVIRLVSATLSTLVLAGSAGTASAYDANAAAKIAPVAGKMTLEALAKGGGKVSAEDFLKMLARKEAVTVLDVRTPAEAKVIGPTMPGALHIPMDQLFKKENLDRLPTTGTIVVVCHSGSRATAAAALLGVAGFGNVVYLNGGLIALMTATTPKAVASE